MEVNYLRDEMNAHAKGMKLPEISEFYRGWRLACEAMAKHQAALTPPQPVADWREGCVVEKCEDGDWDVVSPCRKFWLARTGWFPFTFQGKHRLTAGYFLGGEASARAALDECSTPPPGVGK